MPRRVKMALAVLVGSILIIGGFWFISPHETKLCPTCSGSCVNGRVPCTGHCLKRDDPNWSISTSPHFGPGTYTLRFRNDDGSYAEVSRLHVGQTMTLTNGVWALGGPCPLCNGTNQMTDPSCGGKLPCATCKGKGEIRK